MFNPAQFRSGRLSFDFTPYTEHPMLNFVKGNKFKPVPSKESPYDNMYYLVGKDNKFVVTYYEPRNSMQFNDITLDEFKAIVQTGGELKANNPHVCGTELDRLSDLAYVLMSNMEDEHEEFFLKYIKQNNN